MNEKELTKLIILLNDLAITGLHITYSGGGDEGCIDTIIYTKTPCKDIESVRDYFNENYREEDELINLDGSINTSVHDVITDLLLNDIEDWWNNEGGYGDVYLHVPSGAYFIDNNCYISSIETYNHSGKLLQKAVDGTSL